MLNVKPNTESRCRVSVVWPAEICTGTDFPSVYGTRTSGITMSQNIQVSLRTTFYHNVLYSYRVQCILGGLYSASQNTKQNNQANTP